MATSMGFSLAGSRAAPRGSQKVCAKGAVAFKKDSSSAEERKSAEQAVASEVPGRPRVFLDITLDSEPIGRIVCELFSDITPRTAENFRQLCRGGQGFSSAGKPLHFKGCPFHRVLPNLGLQGGDITRGDGSGGESVYGSTFEDENFDLLHNAPGRLSMVNKGPNTNNSQFFVLTKAKPSLDKKNVVFGRVIEGMQVVQRVEASCGVADEGLMGGGTKLADGVHAFRPKVPIAMISDCGELPGSGDEGGGVAEIEAPSPKRPRVAKPERTVHLFSILKKHSALRLPETWQGKKATLTRGKAKLAVENLRKRLISAPSIQTMFVELAREHSDDASAACGGDLGSVSLESLPPEGEKVAAALSVGALSEVFESSLGVQLLLRTA